LCKMFPDRQCNVDGVKTLIKEIDMTGSIDRQQGSVVHAVRVRLPASTKLGVLHSAKKINHRHTIVRRIGIFVGSGNTISKNYLHLMCLKKSKAQSLTGANNLSVFNSSKTRYLQTCKYDDRITSPAAMNIYLCH